MRLLRKCLALPDSDALAPRFIKPNQTQSNIQLSSYLVMRSCGPDLSDQAEREAVGERAVEQQSGPCQQRPKSPTLSMPSEAQARSSAQLVCAPWATFFREFLFCQKRKLPPAGKALHPPTKSRTPQAEGSKQQTANHRPAKAQSTKQDKSRLPPFKQQQKPGG